MKLTNLGIIFLSIVNLSAVKADSLEQSISSSLLTYPKIKQAYDLYQSRTHQIDQARAGYKPKLEVGVGLGSEWTEGTKDHFHTRLVRRDTSISLNQILFDGFDTSSNVGRTKAEAEAQRLTVVSTAENTALRVTEVYTNMLKQQEIYDLSKDNLATHEQILSDITRRTTSGVGSSADLTQIQGRVARAYANMAAAQNNLDDARAQYVRVVNKEPVDLIVPSTPAELPVSLDDALKHARTNNPILLSALQDIEAGKYQAEGAKANNYPKVSIEASKNWYQDYNGAKGDQDYANIMLRVRYNLYNGGADAANVDSTAALYNQAKDIHAEAYREVEEGTRLAWQALDSLKKQKDFLQKHVAYSVSTVRAYKQQFTLGQRSLLDVLNTENELFDAHKDLIVAQYDELYAQYRVLNAMGALLNSVKVKQKVDRNWNN